MRPEFPNDRDYFFDNHENIYQVIGYSHPLDSVYCLHKYSPLSNPSDNKITWKSGINTKDYIRIISHYSSSSATTNIKNNPYRTHSELYGVDMIQFPTSLIKLYLNPRKKLQSLINHVVTHFHDVRDQEKYAVEISHLFETELRIPIETVGVTGSILWQGIHENSDIDLVIYGLRNTKQFFQRIERLIQSHHQIRTPNLTEQFNLAHLFAQKSGLSFEDCTVFISNKKFLLHFSKFVLSIAFSPNESEIKNNTLASANTRFINIPRLSRITIKATVADDSWMYFYPGVIYLTNVQIDDSKAMIDVGQICRVVIFEHENIGYYKRGNHIEIRGLIQKIENPPSDTLIKCKDVVDITENIYQIIVGTSENYGNEYVKNLEI